MTISLSESNFGPPLDLVAKTIVWLDPKSYELIGMKETVINGPGDIYKIGQVIEKERTVGATKFNNVSSRTHAFMTINVYTLVAENMVRVNKFKLLDLAGSERVSQIGAKVREDKQ